LVPAPEGRDFLTTKNTKRTKEGEFRRGSGVGGAIRRSARGVAAKGENHGVSHDPLGGPNGA